MLRQAGEDVPLQRLVGLGRELPADGHCFKRYVDSTSFRRRAPAVRWRSEGLGKSYAGGSVPEERHSRRLRSVRTSFDPP